MARDSSSLRLVPELIPQPLWDRSVYKSLKRSQWECGIRDKVMEKAGGHCEVCGTSYKKGMVCHEVWEYNEKARVARLEGFRLICRACSFVHHLGKAATLGIGDEAIRHLMNVNNVPKDVVQNIVSESFDIWIRRSAIQDWAIEIPKDVVKEYPVLTGIKIK